MKKQTEPTEWQHYSLVLRAIGQPFSFVRISPMPAMPIQLMPDEVAVNDDNY